MQVLSEADLEFNEAAADVQASLADIATGRTRLPQFSGTAFHRTHTNTVRGGRMTP